MNEHYPFMVLSRTPSYDTYQIRGEYALRGDALHAASQMLNSHDVVVANVIFRGAPRDAWHDTVESLRRQS